MKEKDVLTLSSVKIFYVGKLDIKQKNHKLNVISKDNKSM